MTLVHVLVFVVAAILTLHVCGVCVCYASKSSMQRVDDERQTIDARAPYVCACVRSFALGGRGKEEK